MKVQKSNYCDPRVQCRRFLTTSIMATTLPGLLACLFFECALPSQAQVVPSTNTTPLPAGTSTASNVIASNSSTAVLGAPISIASADAPAGTYSSEDLLLHVPFQKDLFTLAAERWIEDYSGVSWSGTDAYKVNYAPIGGAGPRVAVKTTTPLYGFPSGTLTGQYVVKNPYTWTQTRTLRGPSVRFCYGALGKHLATRISVSPAAEHPHTFQQVVSQQWIADFGNSTNNFSIRGGTSGGVGRNQGWTSTSGTVLYTSANNNFSNASGDQIDVEYTGPHLSTGKFGYYHGFSPSGNGTTADPTLHMGANQGLGMTVEKVIGKEGLSGIQSTLLLNQTPGVYEYKSGTFTDTITEIGTSAGTFNKKKTNFFVEKNQNVTYTGIMPYGAHIHEHDQDWYTTINKTYLDNRGFIRYDASSGVGVWHNNQLLTGKTPQDDIVGAGYYLQLLTYPIPGRMRAYVRYDQYLPSNHTDSTTYGALTTTAKSFGLPGYPSNMSSLIAPNTPTPETQFEFSTGTALYLPGPMRSYGSISLDVGMLCQYTTGPHYTFSVGWTPFTNW